MRINNNMSAVITNNQLLGTESSLSDVMEKLSSGFSINHASDNPSGIAIAGKMQAQIDGLGQASTNGSDGISVLQTAEGALNEVTDMIQRMRELSVQAANGTNSDSERESIQKEIDSLLSEIDRVAQTTEFNTINLLDGSLDCRTYANNVTRIATSNSVPSGIYQLRITQAALRASTSTITVSTGEKIVENFDNTYAKVETTTTVTTPALTAGNFDYKKFIDGTKWETVTRDYSGETTETTTTGEQSGLGISGSITINGYPITLAQGSSGEMVYGQLRAACEKGGAIISDYNAEEGLSISSYKYGAQADLKIEFTSVEFAKALGFPESALDHDDAGNVLPTINKQGTDAKLKLYTETDTVDENGNEVKSLFGTQATYSTDGRHITIRDTQGFEMSFLADDGFMEGATLADGTVSDGMVTFNVTDIGSMTLQVGANEGQQMKVRIAAVTTEFMYIDDVDVTRSNGPEDAMDALGDALSYVTSVRSQLGAYENRLEHTTKSLDATEENMTSAISRIEDADMATTMVEYTKLNVLEQAGVSALAQANELPQLALQLLQ
ncbi:flagellin N-terminal helical domain-containing protein [Pseudobutyrivibrio sp.]|uniref:flagellin N-terminal helical domain-containing protein n=1 Tax=Pseudobutyrivibrio sp. TaxID=2014367 RepID=UPI001DDF100A|nr:flagellin [Pseudobutyrivibrio sp.]MBE5910508.1 flagellin [Pseudobutyrivibrio sp.]